MYSILVIGSAGAGKSTYALNLYDHLQVHRHHPVLINLDPSQQRGTYSHDIRDYITTDSIMEATDLGPNASILQAFATMTDALHDMEIEGYCIVDMPGQIEIFVHSQSFLDTLAFFRKRGHCAIVNIFDAINFSSVEKFLGNGMSLCMCLGRIDMPFVNLVSKCDLFGCRDGDGQFYFERTALRTKFHRDVYAFLEENNMLSFEEIRYTEEGMTEMIYKLDSLLQYYDDLDYVEPREE